MRAGKLNKQISIHSLTLTRSTASGQMAQSWSTFSSSVWTGIEYVESQERFGGRTLPERLTKTGLIFSIRYSTGIQENMRIVYDSKNYDIKGIENIKLQNRELKILGELSE